MNRSIFLTSFFGTQSSGLKPRTSPAISSLRRMRPSVIPGPASGVALDVLDRVADGVDLLGVLVADLDLERLLERHDQLDGVERVGPEVAHEGRFGLDLVRIDPELL